ncbi:urease accessory protein [Fistulifera solaris]|uniref:Urease accessory protein n=1 Tax=Fistulifera solaris TaxID=1519565 RepID=A0A1Z5K0Q3_FISSO|nr:urease accessory protein [Fistulifera solaris]|eukprot:GAX19712.1 urease accessory protein [Fistulifera solaris]
MSSTSVTFLLMRRFLYQNRTTPHHCRRLLSSSPSLSSLQTHTTENNRSKHFGWTKHGFGRIQARCENSATTQLTHISHRAPARCIPFQHRTTAAPGAICVLSNYGGGLVQGDQVDWKIHVQKEARLGLITQGANRIYKHQSTSSDEPISQTTLHATVEADGLLVHAPDPVSCFQHSRYRQTSHIQVQHDDDTRRQESVCWMDWFSAGRLSRGERWQQTQLENNTTLEIMGNKSFVCHDNTKAQAQHMGPFSAFGTLLLYGPQVQAVVQECLSLQSQLVRQHTRIRQHPLLLRELRDLPLLAGRCVVGVSHIETNNHTAPLHMVRFLTQSNEDMYRLLHQCLLPLQPQFQYAFYQDRLQSQRSAAVPAVTTPWQVKESATTTITTTTATPFSTQAQWLSYLLSDSSLPVGGFAHSAGLEAAHQLGLVPTVTELEAYIHAVVHSTLQMVSPLVRASHAWVRGPTCDDWNVYTQIQELAHAHLCSNEMSCRVSLDQGRSLLRVFSSWKEEESKPVVNDKTAALARIRRMYTETSTSSNATMPHHHLAPIWGALTGSFSLPEEEACHLLGYCVARDIVSAAVRMNLLGPIHSTELLARTHAAVQAGLSAETTTMLGGCAPLVDAIHPCHNVLSTRLFRS